MIDYQCLEVQEGSPSSCSSESSQPLPDEIQCVVLTLDGFHNSRISVATKCNGALNVVGVCCEAAVTKEDGCTIRIVPVELCSNRPVLFGVVEELVEHTVVGEGEQIRSPRVDWRDTRPSKKISTIFVS